VQPDADAVWAETTDGPLLRQLFGHYPTLKDAVIQSLCLKQESRLLEMILDYDEWDEEHHADTLTARIRLRWTGVHALDFPLGDQDLLGIRFTSEGELLITYLETWPGVEGRVVSEGFEAILMQVDPAEDEERAWLRFE